MKPWFDIEPEPSYHAMPGLRAWRRELRITYIELSRATGYSVGYLADVFNGKRAAHKSKARAIVKCMQELERRIMKKSPCALGRVAPAS